MYICKTCNAKMPGNGYRGLDGTGAARHCRQCHEEAVLRATRESVDKSIERDEAREWLSRRSVESSLLEAEIQRAVAKVSEAT